MLSYFQAIILGIIQGVTEPFPISSLGHSVLVPKLFGWHNIVNSEPKTQSFFLTFLVAMHVATGLALFLFYRSTWFKLIGAFFSSAKKRKIEDSNEKLIWLIIAATIPAALMGLIFDHVLTSQFAKPIFAAIFLVINGLILLKGDTYIRTHSKRRRVSSPENSLIQTADKITPKRAGIIGLAQVFALIAGISRSGITMVSGVYSGLEYEDAARFSFLLAAPVIFLAGIYKLPSLFKSNANDIRSQIIVGSIFALIACYISVRYLDKYFQTKNFRPFAIYCIVFGLFMVVFTH